MIRKAVWCIGPRALESGLLLVLLQPFIYLLCDLGQVIKVISVPSLKWNISTYFIGLFGYKLMTPLKCLIVLIIDS